MTYPSAFLALKCRSARGKNMSVGFALLLRKEKNDIGLFLNVNSNVTEIRANA